jgi:predicted DNA-binding WGR domain protein
MARFYALQVERDLFGRHGLVRHWGRVGTAGKTRLDEHTG